MSKTKIEWATTSWNPITGCSPISEGCANCYAARMARRLAGRYEYPKDNPFDITLHTNKLTEPASWKTPQKVFVCSMGDLFHEFVPIAWQSNVFATVGRYPQHTFMLLTKRPDMMAKAIERYYIDYRPQYKLQIPNNLWLGVTAENQRTADERIPILLQIPAAVRFVSVEPMLEPVDLNPWLGNVVGYEGYAGRPGITALTTKIGVRWVICGPETGPRARPMCIDWVRDLQRQCHAAGVPFFDKKDVLGETIQEWPR